MSNERSPRASCSTTIGTIGIALLLVFVVAGQPAQDAIPREPPLVAELAARQLAGFGHRSDRIGGGAQQGSGPAWRVSAGTGGGGKRGGGRPVTGPWGLSTTPRRVPAWGRWLSSRSAT